METLFALALPPEWKIAVVLGLLVLAVVLFARETLPVDVLTLVLLLALVGTGTVSVATAFSGFSSEIIVMLASLFVLGGALQETGVVEALGARLLRLAKGGENRLLLALMGAASGLSAFMNNTTVTALLVGPALNVSQKVRISPSKILLPLAYASILGGTCTLIGTSTNIAVSGYISAQKLKPLGLFEITPIGLVIVGVGFLYLLLFGKRLLPAHADESLTEDFAIRDYLSEIIVMPKSPLIGQRIFESDLARLGFRVLKVLRGRQHFMPSRESTFEAGDVLLVKGRVEQLLQVKSTEGIVIKPDLKVSDQDLQSGDLKLVEALVTPQSELVGRTLKEADYQQERGLTVLAIYRRGQSLRDKIRDIKLKVGDLLLVQGRMERLELAKRNRTLSVLEELNPGILRKRKGLYVAGFFLLALIMGGLEVLPVSLCFLGAAVLTVLFRCVPPDKIYQYIEWRLLILIGGMTAFGQAMVETGAARLLADGIVGWLEPLGVMPILAGFFVLTILLTQPMSNAAAALVVLPVALETAHTLRVNERTFAIAIMLAASVSFITPLEPSCLLVYGPGKYRFRDFVKVGVGLTLVLSIILIFLIPKLWPL